MWNRTIKVVTTTITAAMTLMPMVGVNDSSLLLAWAPAGYFSRGEQFRGSGDSSSPTGFRGGARVGFSGEAPVDDMC